MNFQKWELFSGSPGMFLCRPLSVSIIHSFHLFSIYGIIVWGLTYDCYLNQLFILQKKILRCIKFQPFTAPSAPLFHSFKIIKLQDMLHSNISTFAYKAIHKLSPVRFHNYFSPNSSVHRIETRHSTRGDQFLFA